MRRSLAVVLLAAALLGASAPVFAQCAMCGLSAQEAGDPDTVTWTFLAAVVILLVPVLLLLGAFTWLLWTARRWDGAFQAGVKGVGSDEAVP